MSVQDEINEAARRVVEVSVELAKAAGKDDDRKWLLREIEGRVRAALVEAVWGAEKDAGRALGSTQTLRLK